MCISSCRTKRLDRPDPLRVQACLHIFSDAAQVAQFEPVQAIGEIPAFDHHQAVRFPHIGGGFCKKRVRGDSDGTPQPDTDLFRNGPLDFAREFHRVFAFPQFAGQFDPHHLGGGQVERTAAHGDRDVQSARPAMQGRLALVLHAHLPFVRHPEHERFLEENWFFEAVAECYLPLLQILDGWQRDGVRARLTLSLSPTLCSMLQDELLQTRCRRHIKQLLELAEKEVVRTRLQKDCHELACAYRDRFAKLRDQYQACGADLVGEFRKFQDAGVVEIITTAATHAVLPLLAGHTPSLRAQILVARDHYRECFGRNPRGIWRTGASADRTARMPGPVPPPAKNC